MMKIFQLPHAECCPKVQTRRDVTFPFQAYLREAVALQHLSRDADAMLSYASGLVEDAKNAQLLQGLVTAASQSAIQGEFAPAVVTFYFF